MANKEKMCCKYCGAELNEQKEFDVDTRFYKCNSCGEIYISDNYLELEELEETDETDDIAYSATKLAIASGGLIAFIKNICRRIKNSSLDFKQKKKEKRVFFYCIFLGWLGVHKFAEKKIWWGLLYHFTVGLFLVGWIIDIVKYKDKYK